MSEIEALQGRIMAAMDRLAQAVDVIEVPDPAEMARLQEALDAEKSVNADLTERVQALDARQEMAIKGLESKLDGAARRVEALDLEMQRLRVANAQLIESCMALRAANAEGVGDADKINAALQAEIEALKAARSSERAEADEIIAALTPLLAAAGPQEGRADA